MVSKNEKSFGFDHDKLHILIQIPAGILQNTKVDVDTEWPESSVMRTRNDQDD